MKNSARKIYYLSGVTAFLGVLTLIVPRFFANPEGAFASASTAILVFLAMLLVTLLFSIYVLGVTLAAYKEISIACRVVGIAPSIALATTLIGLFGFLSY